MDVAEPASALAGGLTMPVLRALASRASPASAAQLHRVAVGGTEAGVRRAVERLARHGVLVHDEIGGRIVYSLNYDHVLHPAVAALLAADEELTRRLRAHISKWEVAPVAAALYGSAARRDGELDSDVDILLVRPSLPADPLRRGWALQVHTLRDQVFRWTGNRCQVTDRTLPALRRLSVAAEPLIDDLLDDAVRLAGADVGKLLADS